MPSVGSGINRRISCNQVKLRKFMIRFDGTVASPAAATGEAPDNDLVDSIIKTGTGDYTIVLKDPFIVENAYGASSEKVWLSGWSSYTAGVRECVVIPSSDHDRITVELKDNAGAAIDGEVFLEIVGSDARYFVGR